MVDLAGLFDPDRVLVIGATDRPDSVGRALLTNLTSFEGDVVGVNPDRETVLGVPCYPRVEAVPGVGSGDLAVVAVPAPAVVDVVREAAAVGVRSVVVLSAGFREAGDAGARRERELAAVAAANDLALVGPNCLGLIATGSGLNATFARGHPPEGSVSLLSQSGAFIAAVLSWAADNDVGFNNVVSLGNEAVLDEVDFLAEWGADPETDVVLAYLEDVDDGRRFVETARRVTADTPVVAVKAGRTDSGARAAASHTGSLAGSDVAYDAGFRAAGVLRAETVSAAFDYAEALAGLPLPAGDDVAVVTNGGGPGVLAIDAVDDSPLSAAEFDADTRRALEGVLPARAAVGNPLDLVGDADLDRFHRAVDAVLGSSAVDAAVVIAVPTALVTFDALANTLVDLQGRHGKPVVACFMGGTGAGRAGRHLGAVGVPTLFDPARAVGSLAALSAYRDVRDRMPETPTKFDVDRDRARGVLADAAADGRDRLSVEAMDLLDAYGIPTPPGGLARSAAEAERIAERVGGPVALKLASPDLLHKSDVGGVALDVPLDAVSDTYRAICERAEAHDPTATVLGVRVEAMVALPEATETIVGTTRDPQFGQLVLFGLGGVFVQLFEDTAVRIAPVGEREARAMTEEIRAAPMLRGARGRTPADLDALVETIQRVSQLATDFPAIAELDVNPLVVSPAGVRAVDFRLTLDGDAFSEGG